MRIAVFLLLGVAGLTALSTLVGSGEPSEASARERDEQPLAVEPDDAMAEVPSGAALPPPPPSRLKMPSALEEFLESDHSLVLPQPRPEIAEWTWEDDSVQIVFDACKPVARDPLVPKAQLSLRAPVDFGALNAIEDHFGFDPRSVFSLQTSMEGENEYSLASHLGDDVIAALARRGIIVDDSTIRADFPWLVAQTAPHLRPLSQSVIEEWARSMPAPKPTGPSKARTQAMSTTM